MNRTLKKIRQRFYWLQCHNDVKQWCRLCDMCVSRKGPHVKQRAPLQEHVTGAPFERVGIDVLGPFPRSKLGNRFLLVIVDYFTKWPEVIPIPSQTASEIADALVRNWITRYGVPLSIHSDQGRSFESRVFQEVCELFNIKKTRTTPLHPQSNGLVERMNRTILQHLSMFVSDQQDDWDSIVPLFLYAYRTSAHEVTGYTPATMLFGHDLRMPCDLALPRASEPTTNPASYVGELRTNLERVHAFARQRLASGLDRMKARYDAHVTTRPFSPGERVWLYNPIRKKGLSPKLQRNWQGPFIVIKRLSDVVYRIRRKDRSRALVVHRDRLCLYQGLL